MTTTVKILTGLAIGTATFFIIKNYQKGKGKDFFGKPLTAPAGATSGVDGFNNAQGLAGGPVEVITMSGPIKVYTPSGSERRYPPHVYIKGVGFTDSHGKVI